MTSRISLKSAAKINLYLEITGNRPDGYHDLVMVLQSIDLCDRLDIRKIGTDEIQVTCNNPEVPCDRTNLVYKAAALMQSVYPDIGGIEIAIDKQIPMGAGLAGGSSNAAAVLVGIDRLWELGLTQSQLCDFAAQLGSDIPFCVTGGTALATGRGEVLSPLPDLKDLVLVICKPRQIAIATAWAYQTFRSQGLLATSQVKNQNLSSQMVAAIASGGESTAVKLSRFLYNDLERVVLPAYPELHALKNRLLEQECLGAMMSGSGSTIFAIAADLDRAQKIAEAIQTDDIDVWVGKSLVRSIFDV
ncbi:4-(cytidine 5'-diphospho)-2-C-methyl-D-erythritol kinase [Pseudanabaena sp. FACHB-1998]|uniref:4-(cytidine 5'-diphospho)-2-C-methyl-D-erythritol kinase n=1 Tax=Pseudanabaena sp. FACHB-1998 TaxID=2692858 RepID=UPI001680AC44|nr:4-(cytidine 5'-diphospho)-2-C-methyl-D-erythritol kinase [Pseudanabaena sp. FACHB-1998]MBD2175810.1 4-(cytidine 5'-diphospho)-2-C-methyl-D-erythritol kinase [Pseudanabaena sp. FACHB-1998]